jgi:hypothetical protein
MRMIVIIYLLYVLGFIWIILPLFALAIGALSASLATNKKKAFALGFGLTMLIPHGLNVYVKYGGAVRSIYNTTKFKHACRRADDDNARIIPVRADGIHILAPKFSGTKRVACEKFCAWIDNPRTYLNRGGGPAFSFVEIDRLRISGAHGRHIQITNARRAAYAIRYTYMRNGAVAEQRVEITDQRTGRIMSRVRQASFNNRTCPSSDEFRLLVSRLVTPIREARTSSIHDPAIDEALPRLDHQTQTPSFQLKSPRGAHRIEGRLIDLRSIKQIPPQGILGISKSGGDSNVRPEVPEQHNAGEGLERGVPNGERPASAHDRRQE